MACFAKDGGGEAKAGKSWRGVSEALARGLLPGR